MSSTRMSIWVFTVFVTLYLLIIPRSVQGNRIFETHDQRPNKAQNTAASHQRVVEFAGRQWVVKSGLSGPGPNNFSDSAESVWVEGGQLHLKIRKVNGIWHAAEVSTVCTQYGIHRFFTVGRPDLYDQNVVAAMFLYKDDQTEVDIEFGKFGDPNAAYNVQYVVQPWDKPGNRERFLMRLNGTYTTHYINWQPSSIQFKSIHGHYQESPPGHVIHEWLYTGADIPAKEDGLKIHINLWLYQGKPPTDGQEVELIVKNAQLPPPGCTIYLPIIESLV